MLFGSPAMLIMVLCTTNGEREERVSPSFSEWIIKNLGTYGVLVEVDELDELELVGWEAGYEFSESVSEFAMWRFFCFLFSHVV